MIGQVGVRLDRRKLVAARLAAAELQPFLAEALYAMSPVETPGTGTFGVDQSWRLFVDPAAVERWSVTEVAGVLLHEVGHLIRDHAGRASVVGVTEADHVEWNLAADAEINEDLLRDGVTLPESHVTPKRLGLPPGKVAEFYFRHLTDGPGQPDHVDRDAPCGPGCHGVDGTEPASIRRALATSGVAGLNEGEQTLLRRRIAVAVKRHAQAGTVGGGWARWAEAVLDPVVDWRPLLRGAVRSAVAEVSGMVDYSYRRPSRRRVSGVILPSMAEPVPALAIVIDTSGSMSSEHLNAAWSEVQEALRSVGVRRDLVTVLMNDVEVEELSQPFGKQVELRGGGGTDLRNGIALALARRPRPGVLIVLTDGYTPWPDRQPPARTVVGLVADGERDLPPVPAWATAIPILMAD